MLRTPNLNKSILKKIVSFLQRKWIFFDNLNRNKAISYHEWEEKELRNTFALLIAGSFLGIPAPPSNISLELLPYIESDLKIMFERMDASVDPIGEMFSILDIG